MKNFFYALTLGAVLFLFPAGSFAQKLKLKSVKIEWEDFGTETFVAVSCTDFNNQFKNSKQIRLVRDKSELGAFEKSTKVFLKSTGTNGINVRGQITFVYRTVRVKYCFDQFGIFYGKGEYYNDKELMELILKRVAHK